MPNVSISEGGLKFVWHCLENYWGDTGFFWLFAAGLLWTLIARREKERKVFWYYTIFLGLTIYNPLLVPLLVPRVVDEAVYYRFFWALPVSAGVAYYLVLLADQGKRTWQKLGIACGVLAVIAYAGVPNEKVLENLQLPSNVYKVPGAVVYACDVIREDYALQKEEAEKNGEDPLPEMPGAIFGDDHEIFVRQYDASVRLTIDRDTRLYYNGSTVVGDMSQKSGYQRKKRLLDAFNSNEKVSVKKFRKAMKKTKTHYLVIPDWYSCHSYMQNAGCVPIAEGEGVIVYRFE